MCLLVFVGLVVGFPNFTHNLFLSLSELCLHSSPPGVVFSLFFSLRSSRRKDADAAHAEPAGHPAGAGGDGGLGADLGLGGEEPRGAGHQQEPAARLGRGGRGRGGGGGGKRGGVGKRLEEGV